MTEQMIIGGMSLTVMLLSCIAAALITALFIRWFTTAVARFKPGYTTVFLVSLVCGVGTNALGFFLIWYMASVNLMAGLIGFCATFLAGFVAHSWALGAFLKHPETGPIGIKSGFVINFASIGAIVITTSPVFAFFGLMYRRF